MILWIRTFSCDLYFANVSFLNDSRVLEFANEYLIGFYRYINIGVFNISENFEFPWQRIREF